MHGGVGYTANRDKEGMVDLRQHLNIVVSSHTMSISHKHQPFSSMDPTLMVNTAPELAHKNITH